MTEGAAFSAAWMLYAAGLLVSPELVWKQEAQGRP